MFYLQHRVGAQSNVLVSAHYAPTTPTHDRLPKEAVYSAVYSIVEKYPELSLIAVREASNNGKKHRLLLAAMHEIDLETCVEFHDDEEPVAGPKVIERIHNECPDNRTKTRVATIRISAARMRRIIAACRERKTSFTPLLIVMILSTLACDYYPEAKVGLTNCALDMRSLYPQVQDGGRLLQCGGGTRKLTWLNRYRRGMATCERLSSRHRRGN
ncbi:hypothetical protein FOXG_15918 [Fusarium oxysporum f. sp. lycopersici 4287]|uniref:Uncharacterized protein n=2 Tax=Fusarium oxysporum TaxID=5507 RepID=A0A0J9W613_FUSO4|nr:hypothetical protein FOXG_15918 [Fusarium oxysporum f. sp. lycopersici 4287]KNB18509.1 hypothetical protein FOXG_15918 [Fusarium oxysporum f. sp. lycopersici 4287]